MKSYIAGNQSQTIKTNFVKCRKLIYLYVCVFRTKRQDQIYFTCKIVWVEEIVCTRYQKEDMHSDSDLIIDRTQLFAAVESLLYNCPLLRLHTGDKPYETTNSLWMVLFNYNCIMSLCYLIKIDVGETNGYRLQAIPYTLYFILFYYYYYFFFFFFILGYICFRQKTLSCTR